MPPLLRPSDIYLHRNSPIGGAVFRGTMLTRGEKGKVVAVKTGIRYTDAKESMRDLRLEHPHVVCYTGFIEENDGMIALVMERYTDGSVMQYLFLNPSADRASLVLDIAHGMAYLHGLDMIHGKLKPSNILISHGCALISDFIPGGQISTDAGAYQYWSPEAWHQHVSRASDVYAFAMTAYEIFTSQPPYPPTLSPRAVRRLVRTNVHPAIPTDQSFASGAPIVPDRIWGIMEECWDRQWRLRPSFPIILRLWGVDKSGVRDIPLNTLAYRKPSLPDTSIFIVRPVARRRATTQEEGVGASLDPIMRSPSAPPLTPLTPFPSATRHRNRNLSVYRDPPSTPSPPTPNPSPSPSLSQRSTTNSKEEYSSLLGVQVSLPNMPTLSPAIASCDSQVLSFEELHFPLTYSPSSPYSLSLISSPSSSPSSFPSPISSASSPPSLSSTPSPVTPLPTATTRPLHIRSKSTPMHPNTRLQLHARQWSAAIPDVPEDAGDDFEV